jgi:hypothetical protein
MAPLVRTVRVVLLAVAGGLMAALPASPANADIVAESDIATGSDHVRADLIARIGAVPPTALYGLQDSAGVTMDTAKVIQIGRADYLAVYHTCARVPCAVRLARSRDLRTFEFVRTLDASASQPYLARLPDWSYLLAAESEGDNHLRFRRYLDLSALLAGQPAQTLDPQRSLSQCATAPWMLAITTASANSASIGTSRIATTAMWAAVRRAVTSAGQSGSGSAGRSAGWRGHRGKCRSSGTDFPHWCAVSRVRVQASLNTSTPFSGHFV